MRIGIISGCKGKDSKNIFSCFKRLKTENLTLCDKDIEILRYFVKGNKLEKKIKKAEEKLKLKACSVIFKETELKSENEKKELGILENKMFFDLSFSLYKEYLRLLELKAYKMKLLIIDKDMTVLDKAVLERLCFYASSCDVLTENKNKADELADFIFKQNGFILKTSETVNQNAYDGVFDINNKTLKVDGKIFIKDIDLGIAELKEFGISPYEIKEKLESKGFEFQYNKTAGSTAIFEVK